MNSEELTGAVESLAKLEHHYKSQYEDYLAKALAAKANLDRLEILLKDLSSQIALYPEEQESFLEFEPEEESLTGSREQLELDWMGALIEDDSKPDAEPDKSDDKTENQEISHREFVELSSQVMPILESIFDLELGRTLHINYLQKKVNQKIKLDLTTETVQLYLDEAIKRGYCGRDIYDSNCYVSVLEPKTLVKEPFTDNPYKRTYERKTRNEEVKEKQQQNQEESVTLTKPTHNLPPNPRVKMTVPDTIMGYIAECQPKTFTHEDVLNYLYSDGEQKRWSEAQTKKVIKSIRGGLSHGNNRNWIRVRAGVYKPLLPKKDNSNSVTELEKIEPTTQGEQITHEDVSFQQTKRKQFASTFHSLPLSPKVQITIPDTIMGYIAECQPDTFTIHDVVNYLYSDKIQASWSKTQKNKVISAISGCLCNRKSPKWRRVKNGVYQPLFPLELESFVLSDEDDNNFLDELENPLFSSEAQKITNKDTRNKQPHSIFLTKPNHDLPPSSKVKMSLLDTLKGYIAECQPKFFIVKDVVKYLYSDAEQASWSKTQKKKLLARSVMV